ncbi:MAG TPA: hypothetical protein VF846_10870 [Thermoanaerobaculia bacterium]|jgi:hypothetical protein
MRRVIIALLFALPTIAMAQTWTPLQGGGCIGGSTCGERRLRLPLEDRPIVSVRFTAHDQIGQKADGALRVKIDGNVVESFIDVPRRGQVFTLDVDDLRGRYLVFEPVNDDEVEVKDVAVLYSRENLRRIPRDPDWDRDRDRPRDRDRDRDRPWGGNGGWRAYPRAEGCIGGTECRKNGTRITIALEDAPVLGVRFYAQDAIGTRADGRLSVRIDDTSVSSYIDVQRAGRRHEFDVENVRGSRLVIETTTDDEVEVKDIEVLYGRRGRGRGGNWQRETTHEGGCIGGTECGGRRARIRIPIHGRAVEEIRFYAHDEVGTRAGGRLAIRIDDENITYSMDVTREGRNYTIDGKNIAGDYLIIEPADDDEVVLKDIRVTFREETDEE